MSGPKTKVLSYRRAEWIYEKPNMPTLERCIRDSFVELKTLKTRSVVLNGRNVECLAVDPEPKAGVGILLHLAVSTPGEEASIVPIAEEAAIEVDVETLAAPDKTEFMDGDCFIFIKSDHVCLCATTVSDKVINLYLQTLFKKAQIRKDATMFALLKVADVDKVKLIQSEKVKEVEIRGSLYKASAAYTKRKSDAMGFLGGISKIVRAFADKPHDVTNDSLRCVLVLKTDERMKGGLALGENRIEEIAVDLLNNQEKDDDFVITTKSGQKIGPKEIFVRGKTDIEGHGKSVDKAAAWQALQTFYKTLERTKVLET